MQARWGRVATALSFSGTSIEEVNGGKGMTTDGAWQHPRQTPPLSHHHFSGSMPVEDPKGRTHTVEATVDAWYHPTGLAVPLVATPPDRLMQAMLPDPSNPTKVVPACVHRLRVNIPNSGAQFVARFVDIPPTTVTIAASLHGLERCASLAEVDRVLRVGWRLVHGQWSTRGRHKGQITRMTATDKAKILALVDRRKEQRVKDKDILDELKWLYPEADYEHSWNSMSTINHWRREGKET
jgi:hypothetical protein